MVTTERKPILLDFEKPLAELESRIVQIRELAEELGVVVEEPCLAPLTFASHRYATFHLLMPLYVCRRWSGTATGREGQATRWVRPDALRDYPMPPADEPLIAHLVALL